MKKKLITILSIMLMLATCAIASDLVIESDTQSFNEKESKIKFDGNVKVSVDDAHVVGNKADVTVTKNNQLDTATFYDKPYAYQLQNNKKREVKANILKLSLITKIVRAEGNTQSIVTEGKRPLVMITADTQEYDLNTNVLTAVGGVIIKYSRAMTVTKPKTKNVNAGLYKNIIKIKTKEKNKSNITETDLFVINSRIWSSSLTLVIILPTFLLSKYVNGKENKCLNSLAPSFASILQAVCKKIYFREKFKSNSKIVTVIKANAKTSSVVTLL